jgi:Tfp pilus assembly protein PilO
MKISKGMMAFIIFVILVVFVYVNYTYVYQPRMQKIEQLDRDIEITAKKIAEGKKIAAKLGALKVEYKALLEKLEILEVMLPKEKEIPDLLVMIQDTLTEFNVDFSTFNPQNISWEKDRIYGKLPINMSLTADYFDLIAYLDRIENLPRIIDVKELRLSKTGKEAEKLNISINMFAYVLGKEGSK